MENHIRISHEQRDFNCDKCNKVYVSEWRLKMHPKTNKRGKTKNCHYFNSGKTCPFKKLGCKFEHKKSSEC